MDIFTRMAGVSNRLLRPASDGGFGSGTINLVRLTPAAAPANEWDEPGDPTRTVIPLKANAFGVKAALVGKDIAPGVALLATDKYVISAPIAGGYKPEDILEIDGKPVTVLSVQDIVGAGTVSAIRFIVRG